MYWLSALWQSKLNAGGYLIDIVVGLIQGSNEHARYLSVSLFIKWVSQRNVQLGAVTIGQQDRLHKRHSLKVALQEAIPGSLLNHISTILKINYRGSAETPACE